PGKRLSYQRHAQRAEHWVVVAGTALATLNDEEIIVPLGDTIDIPVGAAHRVENRGTELLVFIEVQRGSYLGEDDIVRLQDDFGRIASPPPPLPLGIPIGLTLSLPETFICQERILRSAD